MVDDMMCLDAILSRPRMRLGADDGRPMAVSPLTLDCCDHTIEVARSRSRIIAAPSFNGRTADSGSAYRGSNPWGAAKIVPDQLRVFLGAAQAKGERRFVAPRAATAFLPDLFAADQHAFIAAAIPFTSRSRHEAAVATVDLFRPERRLVSGIRQRDGSCLCAMLVLQPAL